MILVTNFQSIRSNLNNMKFYMYRTFSLNCYISLIIYCYYFFYCSDNFISFKMNLDIKQILIYFSRSKVKFTYALIFSSYSQTMLCHFYSLVKLGRYISETLKNLTGTKKNFELGLRIYFE